MLEALAQSGEELALKEIARKTGLNVSTCHHLLATLVNRGYVGRSRLGRLYFIGGKVSELSRRRLDQLDVAEQAMPELRRLNQETGETVHLSAVRGHELVTLVRVDAIPDLEGARSSSGGTAVHAMAASKAILAWLPETEIARVVAETGLEKLIGQTKADTKAFTQELRDIRRSGFALAGEDSCCLGAAVRDQHGAVIAAVSCGTPRTCAPGESIGSLGKTVRRCAQRLSEQLGSPE